MEPRAGPEIRRVGPVHTGRVALLHVHLGSGFWCNRAVRRVRHHDEADATYGWKYTGRSRIVPRVRVGCGLIGTPEDGELSWRPGIGVASTAHLVQNSATL